jgi:hypothetical protein
VSSFTQPPLRPTVSAPANGVLRDPAREYVAAGPGSLYAADGGVLLAQAHDDVVRQFGPRVYDLMAYDNACATALYLLVSAALGEGIQLEPAVRPEPGAAVTDPDQAARFALAEEVYDYCRRLVEADDESVDEALRSSCYRMLVRGCSLAEPVWELQDEGDDAGRQTLARFAAKPNWAWAFRVTPEMKVERVRAWTRGGWADIAREHFFQASFRCLDGDPRGSSVFRAAYTPWNAKLQVYPDYGEYLRKFASASLVLEAGPDAQELVEYDDATGKATTTTVQQQLISAGRAYRNHSVLALPSGTKAHVLTSGGDGGAFDKAFNRFDREIFRSVILATRPVLEAEHGSKADSESGVDFFKLAVGEVRKAPAAAFRRDVLATGVRLNWGDRVARELTPLVHFGAADNIGPDLIRTFADAWQKGLFVDAQLPFLWAKVGAPVPPPEERTPRQPARGPGPPAPGQPPPVPNPTPPGQGDDPNPGGAP